MTFISLLTCRIVKCPLRRGSNVFKGRESIRLSTEVKTSLWAIMKCWQLKKRLNLSLSCLHRKCRLVVVFTLRTVIYCRLYIGRSLQTLFFMGKSFKRNTNRPINSIHHITPTIFSSIHRMTELTPTQFLGMSSRTNWIIWVWNRLTLVKTVNMYRQIMPMSTCPDLKPWIFMMPVDIDSIRSFQHSWCQDRTSRGLQVQLTKRARHIETIMGAMKFPHLR